ncbi:MAG: hypothetical protein Q8L21_02335, partial [Candidatus Komeilibacteria bacterium]|nr:hypothetical protein [Candidatus Komeilibacteria bacterium]
YECASPSAVYESKRFCETKEAGTVPIFNGASSVTPAPSAAYGANSQNSYLELWPDAGYNGGIWKDNTWYQVVLKAAISSGSGTSTAFLAKDKPCEDDPTSAYCFLFKTDAQDCKMKDIIITPYRYWTSVLEAPMKYRTVGGDVYNLFYKGHGLSEQKCILMDVKGFKWAWSTSTNPAVIPPQPPYADIFSGANTRDKVQASALANTVGVNLTNPVNAVNIHAEATTSTLTLPYKKDSPLTIDLSNPQVVDYWPKCLETCTNAEVAVKFNTTMSNQNLSGAAEKGSVQLLKCLDENCLQTQPVANSADIYLDQPSNYTVLKIANSQFNSVELVTGTIYQVKISARHSPAPQTPDSAQNTLWSAAIYNVPSSYSKPFNQEFTWRFRTKKDKCKIDRVEVLPKVFTAYSNKAKATYAAQPFSAPDSCDARGQKLNPWAVSWDWTSSDTLVAYVTSFTTKGKNPYCTSWCVRKGSDIPTSSAANLPVCGNAVVEAGEDCDPPGAAAGCGLNCLRWGLAYTTTTITVPVDLGMCGDGVVSSTLSEVCDPADP